jgi:hypothetical protein
MNLKKVNVIFKRTIGAVIMLLLLFSRSQSFAATYVDGFKLKNCNKENTRCLTITGSKADGSDFTPLFYFKHAIVTIEHNSKIEEQLINVEGYFDLSLGRVVVSEKKLTKITDKVIDLNTLQLTKFENF